MNFVLKLKSHQESFECFVNKKQKILCAQMPGVENQPTGPTLRTASFRVVPCASRSCWILSTLFLFRSCVPRTLAKWASICVRCTSLRTRSAKDRSLGLGTRRWIHSLRAASQNGTYPYLGKQINLLNQENFNRKKELKVQLI